MVLFKLLRHQWEWIYCLRQLSLLLGSDRPCCHRQPRCSNWRIEPSISYRCPHPYYLTLLRHYIARQRVDRAISYPPELAFLHDYQRFPYKIHIYSNYWRTVMMKFIAMLLKLEQQTEMLDLLILRTWLLFFLFFFFVIWEQSREAYIDTDLSEVSWDTQSFFFFFFQIRVGILDFCKTLFYQYSEKKSRFDSW